MRRIMFIVAFGSLLLLSHGDEFRGLWPVTTFTAPSPENYQQLFENMRDYGFNNAMYYTFNMGQVNYPSNYLPWNEALTGTMGQDPGWDPLAYAIQCAHERNIRVHTKINTFYGWASSTSLPTSAVHLANTHPEWFLVGRDGKMMSVPGENLFLNPCRPEVQQLIYLLCIELVNSYAVDGLHFDFIRYPNKNYSYDPVTLNRFWARFGNSPDALPSEWDQWRRDQITYMLLRIKTVVRRNHWNVLFGADVWASRTSGFNNVLQDMERWREMKIMDFDVPMLYTTNISSFESWLADHQSHAHGRAVYSGIAVHQMGGNTSYLDEQITLSRDRATSGVVLYKDESLFPNNIPNAMADYLKAHFFSEPTSSPVYLWKMKSESVAPSFAGLALAEPRSGMAVLRWEPASDASLPITYTIYQSTTAGGEDFTTPTYATQETRYLVEGLTNGNEYHFVVRAEDDFANEDGNIIECSVTPLATHDFMIEDFESGTNAYWAGNHTSGIVFQDPNYSTYTHGVDASSAIDVVSSPTHAGGYAGRLQLSWTDPTGGLCFLTTEPTRPLCPDFTGWFALWVYGANDGTKIAAVFRDNALERTPYVTVDWSGWRLVEWFLPATQFTGWNGGDGKLSGGVFGGEFAGLLILPGSEVETTLYLDDVENQIRPDARAPQFAGLRECTGSFYKANLSWDMAMDGNNPITYNVYMATSPSGFDFSTPIGSTTALQYAVFLPSPGTSYYFVVRAEDTLGNEDQNMVVKGISVGEETLENFEAGTPTYWHGNHSSGIIFEDPNYSGSTTGLDDTSRWEIVSTPTVAGTFGGRLYLKWTDMLNGFCRVTTHPDRPVIQDYRVTLSAWVYGAADNSRMALALLDDLHAGAGDKEYEISPYITIDWSGWQKIEWVLPEVAWTSWQGLGTGELEDLEAGGHLEALFFLPGDATETTLYFDELTLLPLPPPPTPTPTPTPAPTVSPTPTPVYPQLGCAGQWSLLY